MAKFERRSWQSEVVMQITEAEPMLTGYGPTFVPNMARLLYENGEFVEVRLFGPRVLTNGKPSKRDNDFVNWKADDVTDPDFQKVAPQYQIPDWVKDMVISATFARGA